MPIRKKPPSYRLHRASGQAVVSLRGRDIYLGRYGTKASHHEYDRVIAEWLSSGGTLPGGLATKPEPTVLEVVAAFWKHV